MPILPPLRRTAADAEAFARVVHAGQVDKAGRPYVEHLERVADRVALATSRGRFAGGHEPVFEPDISERERDEAVQIAWLHDTIEDTDHDEASIFREGFSMGVVTAVGMLAGPGTSYIAWIQHLVDTAPLPVLIVKLADMEDNADPERLALLPDDVRARLERKYGPALEMLRAAMERGAGRDG